MWPTTITISSWTRTRTSSSSSTPHGAGIAKRTSQTQTHNLQPYPSGTANRKISLAPKYEELAAFYFNDPTYSKQVTIAKVDATANDVPDEIAGFPTIKLFPAGAKSDPVTYTGSRTVEDLATFIKENGKHQVDAYVANDTEEAGMPDADEMGKQAPAATEKAKSATDSAKSAGEKVKEKATEGVGSKVKSVVSEAAEAVKTAVADTDGSGGVEHDEL